MYYRKRILMHLRMYSLLEKKKREDNYDWCFLRWFFFFLLPWPFLLCLCRQTECALSDPICQIDIGDDFCTESNGERFSYIGVRTYVGIVLCSSFFSFHTKKLAHLGTCPQPTHSAVALRRPYLRSNFLRRAPGA